MTYLYIRPKNGLVPLILLICMYERIDLIYHRDFISEKENKYDS